LSEDEEVEPDLEGFGWCDFHQRQVDEREYCLKGCWGCHHFEYGKSFPYVFVSEASSELGVSESTIRRWIKSGRLQGEKFVKVRQTASPVPKKYHIEKASLRRLIAQKKLAQKREG